jgi:hypothetical protein
MADETLNLNNNNNYALVQPFKAESDSTATTTASQTLEIKPLSQTSSETLEIKPLSQTSSETLELRPVRSDASSTVDLKPVALDVCVRTGPASLLPTHICEPYHHRIGFTLLGVEMFGLAWSGEQQTIIDDRGGRPMVAWGDVTLPPPRVELELPQRSREPAHHHYRHSDRDSGLRIRLAD